MFDINEIKKMLFIDIETVSCKNSLEELEKENSHLKELWDKRTTYLRDRFPENKELNNDELFRLKGGLHSEFSKIVCISLSTIKTNKESDELEITVKSIYNDDEKDLLTEFFAILTKFHSVYKNEFKIVGHNIKRFDIPFLCKRGIINKLVLPNILHLHKIKPWDFPIIDTSELWSHGAWQESFTSLDLLCNVLNVPTPKDQMEAKQVQQMYYEGKLSDIVTYCEKDIVATLKCLLEMSNIDSSEIKINSNK